MYIKKMCEYEKRVSTAIYYLFQIYKKKNTMDEKAKQRVEKLWNVWQQLQSDLQHPPEDFITELGRFQVYNEKGIINNTHIKRKIWEGYIVASTWVINHVWDIHCRNLSW